MALDRDAATAAISAALNLITDENPIIEDHPDYSMIRFTPGQQEKFRAYINNVLTGKPGAIRFDTDPIVNPIILKTAIPYALAILAVGFVLGRLSGKVL